MLHTDFFKTKEDDVSLEKQGGTIEERVAGLLELKDVNDDGFNPVNFRAAVEYAVEKKKKDTAKGLIGLMTENMTKTLDAIIEKGPMEDGDLPSKPGRDELVTVGMVIEVAGKDGKKLSAASMDAAKLYEVAGVEVEEEESDEKDDD